VAQKEPYPEYGPTSVDHLVQARERYNVEIMGAVPDDNSWQAHQQGYDSRHFTIDWANETAICPKITPVAVGRWPKHGRSDPL
jgi:hypothetical protein